MCTLNQKLEITCEKRPNVSETFVPSFSASFFWYKRNIIWHVLKICKRIGDIEGYYI